MICHVTEVFKTKLSTFWRILIIFWCALLQYLYVFLFCNDLLTKYIIWKLQFCSSSQKFVQTLWRWEETGKLDLHRSPSPGLIYSAFSFLLLSPPLLLHHCFTLLSLLWLPPTWAPFLLWSPETPWTALKRVQVTIACYLTAAWCIPS